MKYQIYISNLYQISNLYIKYQIYISNIKSIYQISNLYQISISNLYIKYQIYIKSLYQIYISNIKSISNLYIKSIYQISNLYQISISNLYEISNLYIKSISNIKSIYQIYIKSIYIYMIWLCLKSQDTLSSRSQLLNWAPAPRLIPWTFRSSNPWTSPRPCRCWIYGIIVSYMFYCQCVNISYTYISYYVIHVVS